MLRLSFVIPCRNDAAELAACLMRLQSALNPQDEIIIADASDDPDCANLAATHGARVVHCPRSGRGPQMNAGAAAATGDVLVFTHADTELSTAHAEAIRHTLTNHPERKAGAFFKDTPAHYPAWAWADPLVRQWMQRCGLVYGDQSVFLRRSLFDELGGFAELPLMEDVEMSRRLRRTRAFALIDPPLRTSMRRFAGRGRLLTRLQHVAFVWLYRLGVPAPRLWQWYYAERRK